jgi:hypothetical protein
MRLRKQVAEVGMTDISAIGTFLWTPTRVTTNGPNNKLDTVMVSNKLIKQQQATVTHFYAGS